MPKERFQFDMSAAKDKKRRRRNRQGMSGAVETSTRICEHPSCNRVGKYRAPKAPGGTGEFHWFCRQHVRQYNSQWDFFKISEGESTDDPTDSGDGQSPEERREQREQLAWQRLGIKDPFEILGESGTRSGHAHVASARLSRNERRALNILDAKDGWGKKGTSQAIQIACQGSSPRHERRRPERRRSIERGRLGMGSAEGQQQYQALSATAALIDSRTRLTGPPLALATLLVDRDWPKWADSF